MSTVVRLAILLALLLGTSVVRAQPPSHVDEGRARFNKGVALFRTSEFRAALVEFNRAYAIAPSYRIQFNIGQTCAELQDHVCAMKAFERYLADGSSKGQPAHRTIAEGEVKRLRSLVASVRVFVNVPGAEISVDDVRVGMSPVAEPISVSAGRRKLTATRPPLAPVSMFVDVAGGDATELHLDLVAASPAAVAAPHASAPAPSSSLDPPSRTPFWVGVGTTSALAIATVTFGMLSVKAKSDLDSTLGRFGASASAIEGERTRLERLTLVTNIVGGTALAAAALTTVLHFTTKPSKESSSQVGIGPGWVTVAHTF